MQNQRGNLVESIRDATEQDAELLAELGRLTFYEAFHAVNTPDDMQSYLESAFSAQIQAEELRRPGSIYKIAYSSIPVGYARLLAGSDDPAAGAQRPIELVRLYVRSDWQGKGIGGMLINNCIQTARQLGHDVIWLGVWQKNPDAIRLYQRWGFEIVGTHTFRLGSDPQQDYVMRLVL